MAVVIANKRTILVPLPDKKNYDILSAVFPTRFIPTHDGGILALPHCADSMRMLHNMGINVDGCELFHHYYTPPTHPDGHSPGS